MVRVYTGSPLTHAAPDYIQILRVDEAFAGRGSPDSRMVKLIKDDIAPGTGVDKEQNFGVFGKLILRNVPRTSDSTA